MKAAVVCANEDVRYMDYEEPQVTPGTVKIKVKASGICGSDIPRVLHNGVHFYPIVLDNAVKGNRRRLKHSSLLIGNGFVKYNCILFRNHNIVCIASLLP